MKKSTQQSKLVLAKDTIQQLTSTSLSQAAGGGTSGYGMCKNYATLLCSVGGGRGACNAQ
ncbi:MAG: class I lanthipeptide [Deltaproteobacteria bacterium]|nr:class I lanthipeptide [Deltaproteobacteria bacterium]